MENEVRRKLRDKTTSYGYTAQMGITDDPINQALQRFSKESDLEGGKEALLAIIASIPLAGGAMSSLLSGGAKRRVADRAQEVFEAVRERFRKIEKDKIDEEYFKTDEFMTILVLTLEQLQTTHDKNKREMLATAITNSGRIEFSSESRKELFMRILRDLSPQHISLLVSMGAHAVIFEQLNPTGERLSLLQSLAAHGLVQESYDKQEPSVPAYQITSQREVEDAITKMIMSRTTHRFRISEFGLDFLRFFDSSGHSETHSSGAAVQPS